MFGSLNGPVATTSACAVSVPRDVSIRQRRAAPSHSAPRTS
jgi:hypothetical protein